MGLAASHARLCMLTRRKADVESRLMRVSNAKMALARDSERVSKEYTRALNATSLVYNMGNKDVPLTYGLIMNPSTQCMLTNSAGNVVLDQSLADDLKLTGASGKGTPPVSALDFVNKKAGTTYTDLSSLGGAAPTVKTNPDNTTTITTGYDDKQVFKYLSDKYSSGTGFKKDFWNKEVFYSPDGSVGGSTPIIFWQGSDSELTNNKSMIYQQYLLPILSIVTGDAKEAVINAVKQNLGSKCTSEVSKALNAAGDKASEATIARYQNQLMTNVRYDMTSNEASTTGKDDAKGSNEIFNNTKGKAELVLDPNQIIKTFLNYFDAACGGIDLSKVEPQQNAQKTITDNCSVTPPGGGKTYFSNQSTYAARPNGGSPYIDIKFKGSSSTPSADSTTDTSPSGAAKYYYALYQAICDRGWVRDVDVNNQDYMQGMIQFGGYGVKKYQNGTWVELSQNSPDSPISATTNEEARDKAKAAYDAAKDKIKAKEVEWDVEQTAADTERAAIVADMDSVKKILDKNMDSFKLFQQG